jgi:hypothetical protein
MHKCLKRQDKQRVNEGWRTTCLNSLQEEANFVTYSNEEEGFADAIERIVFK